MLCAGMGRTGANKLNQTQKGKYHVFSYLWVLDFIQLQDIMYVMT